MARYAAFLRAVNVGKRRVDMRTCIAALTELDYDDVSSWVNSGNLIYTGTGKTQDHEQAIRSRLEDEYGFEITTFVRTAAEVESLASDKPFGALASGHTHFVLMPLTKPTAAEKKAVAAMSNDHDEVVAKGRDFHWLIKSKSTETTLGPKQWRDALPDNPTTARNTTMLAKLASKL